MKRILITGANGFIAQKIARALKEEDNIILGTSRNPSSNQYYDEIVPGIFGEPLKDVFENQRIDVVVHCAYDKDDMENVNNAEGTLKWAEQAEKNNVGQQIFMSSISADANGFSPYGQKKYEVEKWFEAHDQIVFRLGLVVGDGGVFGRIVSTVKRSPIIPLIDRGETLMYLSDVDTVSEIVRDTILGKNKIEKGRIWRLNQEEPVFFVDILREIRTQYNLFRMFVPVPYFVVSILLSIAEKIKFLKLGINTNNLKWSRQVRDRKFESDLEYLGYRETTIEKMINKLLT